MIHLKEKVFNKPLMLEKTKAQIILDVLAPRFGMNKEDVQIFEKDAALFGEFRTSNTRVTNINGVAVVPIIGTLIHRRMGLEPMSGLISYQEIADMVITAAKDESVRAIMLDIDSGGGEVSGVFDLAETIREIDETMKPVYAISNEAMYSAAYAIGSAARQIFVARTAGVGSIGVLAEHVDISAQNEMLGLKVTPIFAGDLKVERSPDFPLSDAAAARIQSEVDDTYTMFVNHVARMRGINVQSAVDTQAGLFFGVNAVSSGLADEILSFDQAIEFILNTEGITIMSNNQVTQTGEADKMKLFSKVGKDDIEQEAEAVLEKEAEAKVEPDAELLEIEQEAESVELEQEASADEQEQEQEAPEAAPAPAPQLENAELEQEAESVELEQEAPEVNQAAHYAEIAKLANEAGQPDRIEDFIKENMSIENVKAELDKRGKILAHCDKFKDKLGQSFIDKMLESDVSVAEAQEKILDKLAKVDDKLKISTKPDAKAIDNEAVEGYANDCKVSPLVKNAEERANRKKK